MLCVGQGFLCPFIITKTHSANMYIGYFKDINNHDYSVKIIPSGTEGTEKEITLSDNPVTITQKSDGLFDELKLTGCTSASIFAFF